MNAAPPAQEGGVATKLLIVLIDATGAVVLHEHSPRRLIATTALHLEDGVGAHEPGARVAQALRRPVTLQTQLRDADLRRRLNMPIETQRLTGMIRERVPSSNRLPNHLPK